MAKPTRNAAPDSIQAEKRTFFFTSKIAQGKFLLQSERMASLLIDVVRAYVSQGQFIVHEFVVMRDHIHLIITVDRRMAIEKAVQLIKGKFSYRAGKELGLRGNLWQGGFSEVRILHRASFLSHRAYIEQNPVKAGLVKSAEEYPYCSLYLRRQKAKEGR